MNAGDALRKRITEICAEHNISYYELSKKMETNTIANYMSKKNKTLYLPTIYRMCSVLNITLKDFFDTEYFANLK